MSRRESGQGQSKVGTVAATATTTDGSNTNTNINSNSNSNRTTATADISTREDKTAAIETSAAGATTRKKRNRLSKRSSRGRDSGTFTSAAAVISQTPTIQPVPAPGTSIQRPEEIHETREVNPSPADDLTPSLNQPPPTPVTELPSPQSSSSSTTAQPTVPPPPETQIVADTPHQREGRDKLILIPAVAPSELSPHLRRVEREHPKVITADHTSDARERNTPGTIPHRSRSLQGHSREKRNNSAEGQISTPRRRLSKRARHLAQQRERAREAEIREMSATVLPASFGPGDLKRPASRTDNLQSSHARKNSKKLKSVDLTDTVDSTQSLPVQATSVCSSALYYPPNMAKAVGLADENAHAYELGMLEQFRPRPALRISLAHHQEQFRERHYKHYNISNSTNNSRSQQHLHSHSHQQQQRYDENDQLQQLDDNHTSPKTKRTRPTTPMTSEQLLQQQRREKHLTNVTHSLSRRKGKRPDQINEKLKRSSHRPVDSLANELDSGALREVMERDRRRRERKKLLDAEKVRRRLEGSQGQQEDFLRFREQQQHRQQQQQSSNNNNNNQQRYYRQLEQQANVSQKSWQRNFLHQDEDKENIASRLSPSADLDLVLPPSPSRQSTARKNGDGVSGGVLAPAPVFRTEKERDGGLSYTHTQQSSGTRYEYPSPAFAVREDENSRLVERQDGAATNTVFNFITAAVGANTAAAAHNRKGADNGATVAHGILTPIDSSSHHRNNDTDYNSSPVTVATTTDSNENPSGPPDVVVGTARAVRLSQASMSSVGNKLSLSLSPSPPPSSPPIVPDALRQQQRTMSGSSAQLNALYEQESRPEAGQDRQFHNENEDGEYNVYNNVNITPEPTPPWTSTSFPQNRVPETIPPVPELSHHAYAHASVASAESITYDLKRLQDLQQQQQQQRQEEERREHEKEKIREMEFQRVLEEEKEAGASADSTAFSSSMGSRIVSEFSSSGPLRRKSTKAWRSLFRKSGSATTGSNPASRVTSGAGGISSLMGKEKTSRDTSATSAALAMTRSMTSSEFSFSNTSKEEVLLLRGQQKQMQQMHSSQDAPKRLSGSGIANAASTTGSGTMRKRSKFREDLPELPLSPPDSQLQSPAEGYESGNARSASGAVGGADGVEYGNAGSVLSATDRITDARATASNDITNAAVARVTSTSGTKDADGAKTSLGRSGSGAISERPEGTTPNHIRVGSRDETADKSLPPTPKHKKDTSISTTLASPDSEGSWLTGRAQRRTSQQRSKGQSPQTAGQVAGQGASNPGSARSSMEIDARITNDDYFRKLAMIPPPPPIPDDEYNPASVRIPSSIVVDRRGGGGSTSGRVSSSGSSSSRHSSNSAASQDRFASRAGHRRDENENTTKLQTRFLENPSPSNRAETSPLPEVRGLDVGVNAGIAIPPDSDAYHYGGDPVPGFKKSPSVRLTDDDADGKSYDGTGTPYYNDDFFAEGTLVRNNTARRPVTLTHRHDTAKVRSREVLLDEAFNLPDNDNPHEDDEEHKDKVEGDADNVVEQPALDVALQQQRRRSQRSSKRYSSGGGGGGDGDTKPYAVVRRAGSIDLSTGEYKHARHLSAGSARLLELGAGGSKRGSVEVAGGAAITSTVTTATVTSMATLSADKSATSALPAIQNDTAAATTTESGAAPAAAFSSSSIHHTDLANEAVESRGRLSVPSSHPRSSELRSSSGGDSYRFL